MLGKDNRTDVGILRGFLHVGMALSVVALFALVTGCPTAAPRGGGGADCDPACEEGFRCDDGVCVCRNDAACDDDDLCTTDTCTEGECVYTDAVECPEGEECVDGECVAVDPCADVVCGDGEECVDGECVAVDPCADVVCDEGFECVDGDCVEIVDPCADVVCDEGFECVDGDCVEIDPCADVVCDEGFECVDGDCVPVIPTDLEGANPDVDFGGLTVGETIDLVAPDPTAGTAFLRQPPADCTCAWTVTPDTAGTFSAAAECETQFTVAESGDFEICVEVTCPAVDETYCQGCTAGCGSDAECDDGLFCNGPETCVDGECVAGTDPCTTEQPICVEEAGVCAEACVDDAIADANAVDLTLLVEGTPVTLIAPAPAGYEAGGSAVDETLCSCEWAADGAGTFDEVVPGTTCTVQYTPAADDTEIYVLVRCDADANNFLCTQAVTVSELPPEMSFSVVANNAQQLEGTGGTTLFTFDITRQGGDTTQPATVEWDVTGSGTNPADAVDFTGGVLPGATASFAANVLDVTVTVQVVGDNDVELDEQFTVTLSNPSIGVVFTATASSTILNDDSSAAPVNTLPSNPSVQIAQYQQAILGVSTSDPDSANITVQLTTSAGLLQIDPGVDGPGQIVSTVTTTGGAGYTEGNDVTFVQLVGPIPNVNADLAGLKYTTNRVGTDAGNDTITMTSTDPDDNSDTDNIIIGVGRTFGLTAGADAGAPFDGTGSNDLYEDALGGPATVGDLATGDDIDGADGFDTVSLLYNDAAGTDFSAGGGQAAVDVAENIEQLSLTAAAGVAAGDFVLVNVTDSFDQNMDGVTDLRVIQMTANGNPFDNFQFANLQNGSTIRALHSAALIDVSMENPGAVGVDHEVIFDLQMNNAGTPLGLIDSTGPDATTPQGIETLRFISAGVGPNAVTDVHIAADDVFIEGPQNLAIAWTIPATSAEVVDAGALDGDLTIMIERTGGFQVTGGDGDDMIMAGPVSDTNDTLIGGPGADILRGDGGNDALTGGLGQDTYQIEWPAGPAAFNGEDTYTGFSAGLGGDRVAIAGGGAPFTAINGLPAGLVVQVMTTNTAAGGTSSVLVINSSLFITDASQTEANQAAAIVTAFGGGGALSNVLGGAVPPFFHDMLFVIGTNQNTAQIWNWWDADLSGTVTAPELDIIVDMTAVNVNNLVAGNFQ